MTGKKSILFTAGPLQTSDAVKQTMTVDYGSRDLPFMKAIQYVRETTLSIANLDPKEWACILQPGAGTMGVEAAITSVIPRTNGKYLLINSGKYSERQAAIVKRIGVPLVQVKSGEGQEIDFAALEKTLQENPDVTTVGYVHHETSTGMIYPAEQIGSTVRKILPSAHIVCDAMSSFGGAPVDVSKACDVMVTSPNKCLHSVPGVSIIMARRSLMAKCKGNCRSTTLDLPAQLAAFDKSGQFAVTPPVQVIMALQQALIEYQRDGGLAAREKIYAEKSRAVCDAVKRMGFTLFLQENRPSFAHFVVCVNMPSDPKWSFKKFYTFLSDHGFVIYPGKASHAETFRFGIMGHTSLKQTRALMRCSEAALKSMGISKLSTASKL